MKLENVKVGVLKDLRPEDRIWVKLGRHPDQETTKRVKKAIQHWVGCSINVIVVGPDVEFAVEKYSQRN